MRILVSACLLGHPVRYDGQVKEYPEVNELLTKPDVELIPACPECLGGLPVPRIPAERTKEGNVFNREGQDVTSAFEKGAERTVRLALDSGCVAALLKSRSPSCGSGWIYDGTFSGSLVNGDGLAAERLKKAGIPVYTEKEMSLLKEEIICSK